MFVDDPLPNKVDLPTAFYTCRRGPGQEYVKSSLGVTLMELVNYTHSLEIDPVKVSRTI